jgi:hypothetical protein
MKHDVERLEGFSSLEEHGPAWQREVLDGQVRVADDMQAPDMRTSRRRALSQRWQHAQPCEQGESR